MVHGRGRGAESFGSSKGARKASGSDKDLRRGSRHGRAPQGMGSGGKSGGSKSSGGHGGSAHGDVRGRGAAGGRGGAPR